MSKESINEIEALAERLVKELAPLKHWAAAQAVEALLDIVDHVAAERRRLEEGDAR